MAAKDNFTDIPQKGDALAMTTNTGGCQCGAVRFRIKGELEEASICHCRMCQKATGGLFGAYVGAPFDAVIWSRGHPRYFRSSNKVRRGFCKDCGTPLTFEYGEGHISFALGAMDKPPVLNLTEQLASPDRIADFEALRGLPEHPTDEPRAAAHLASIISFQHPDHDTSEWPPTAFE
ncbi:GFA family protein [Novosphingopyxis baekryungensis]|uniref:GFA family protein n=1 Tax=Novosphingopyxis baekryungensis TaxID=279369 RepID=UPI001FE1B6CC|nr:GFA family protein [Novosphingopyxis baekryungensis]